jgi:hypothetical protein
MRGSDYDAGDHTGKNCDASKARDRPSVNLQRARTVENVRAPAIKANHRYEA